MKKTHLIFILFFITLCKFTTGYTEEITEITPLSFGTIVLLDNDDEHVYRISFAGDVNIDPAYIVIASGQPAEYLLTNFPANTQLTVSILVPETTTTAVNGSNSTTSQFTIDNHHTASPIVTTNSLGEATINVGANLTSSGSGSYRDETFISTMTIIVDH